MFTGAMLPKPFSPDSDGGGSGKGLGGQEVGGLHGANTVAIGSNEGSAAIEPDVGEAGHKRIVLEPASTDSSLAKASCHHEAIVQRLYPLCALWLLLDVY